MSDDIETKIRHVDYGLAHPNCIGSARCQAMVDKNVERLGDKFIGIGEVADKQIVAACLDFDYEDYDAYEKHCRKFSKASAIRNAKKSDKAGYYVKLFDRRMHIPDIVEINTSKEVRSGGKMKASYLRSVDEMGGAPDRKFEAELPPCPVHYDTWWGMFEQVEGYKQGSVVTDERLLAYIDFRRLGNFGLYSLIIGHGDYLKDGVVNRLHLAIMEWLLDKDNIHGEGFQHLMYAGYNQGGEGLRRWKRHFGFEPAYFLAPDAPSGDSASGSFFQRLRQVLRAGFSKSGK